MSDRDVEMAAMSLRAYGVGLLAFMLIKVLAPGYFSRQDTKTPVKIAVKAMVANMVFNLMLIVPLAHAGLALATALSAFMNAGWLLHGLIKQGVFKWQSGWARWSMQLGLANLLMALFVLFLAPAASEWLVRDLWWRIEWMALLVGGAVAVYLVTLALTGVRIRHLRG
jgi:putative peptidoglycan lipid II flippase